MLVLSLSPALGWIGGFIAAVVGGILALVVRKPNVSQPHDWEREYKRVEMKVRHPWKARISRIIGLD